MLHPSFHAEQRPDQAAVIMSATGATVTYGELEAQSNQGAQLFRKLGLKRGDHVAFLMENHEAFFGLCWAAQRSGLYYTPMSCYLKESEVEYIINNCEAKVVVCSEAQVEKLQKILDKIPNVKERYVVSDKSFDGLKSWADSVADLPTSPIEDQTEGREMLYSSGTTGQPKGVKFALSEQSGLAEAEEITRSVMLVQMLGITHETVGLATAPTYHSLGLGFCMGAHRMGCTVVVMEKFDAEGALALIEKYKVGYSQWVPTMFVRLMKLPQEVRDKYDVSSMQMAIHGAAACPKEVKEQIINWWGPVLWEFYSGSERNGIFMIGSDEWMAHKGSVGRCVDAQVHIVDEETGKELPPGEVGAIYCSKGEVFEYHGDADKTDSVTLNGDWTTIGDVGYLDEEGFLYLTDRKSYMIISGGVNVYPQETEDCLILHPKVADAAVFGVPNEDLGEEVKAVVQLEDHSTAGPEMEKELIDYCLEKISKIKCPKSIDFEESLPREETGKLKKRLLKDRYWS